MFVKYITGRNILHSFTLLTLMQAFLDLGELLISTDAGAALEAFKTVWAFAFYSFLSCRFSIVLYN